MFLVYCFLIYLEILSCVFPKLIVQSTENFICNTAGYLYFLHNERSKMCLGKKKKKIHVLIIKRPEAIKYSGLDNSAICIFFCLETTNTMCTFAWRLLFYFYYYSNIIGAVMTDAQILSSEKSEAFQIDFKAKCYCLSWFELNEKYIRKTTSTFAS